jgi:hypothetical protein
MSGNNNIAWGDEVNGLRLGIAAEHERCGPAERPVILKIFIINVRARIVQIIESHVLREYDVEVRGSGGQRVPMNAEGSKALRAARTLPPARRRVVDIEPRMTYHLEPPIRLDEWFDLDVPGSYSVRVGRRDCQKDGGFLVSAPLTFIVDT